MPDSASNKPSKSVPEHDKKSQEMILTPPPETKVTPKSQSVSPKTNSGWQIFFDGFMKSRYDWVFVATVGALMPLIFVQCQYLWQRQHFQFFPIAWIAMLGFIVFRSEPVTSANSNRRNLGLAGGSFRLACVWARNRNLFPLGGSCGIAAYLYGLDATSARENSVVHVGQLADADGGDSAASPKS